MDVNLKKSGQFLGRDVDVFVVAPGVKEIILQHTEDGEEIIVSPLLRASERSLEDAFTSTITAMGIYYPGETFFLYIIYQLGTDMIMRHNVVGTLSKHNLKCEGLVILP